MNRVHPMACAQNDDAVEPHAAPETAPCPAPEIVVLGSPRDAADPAQEGMLRELGSLHYVRHPLELGALRRAGPDLVIVERSAGTIYDVPHLVSVLRSDPRLGIVVRVEGHGERLAAVRAGADLCISAHFAVPALRHELQEVLAYYARPPALEAPAAGADIPAAAGATAPPAADASTAWRLSACGWLWHAPNRRHITLTAQERQVVLALLAHQQSEGQSADPPALARHRGEPLRTRQLTMVVCRLRQKCEAIGVVAPIRSVRGRGYTLTAPCTREDADPALLMLSDGAAG